MGFVVAGVTQRIRRREAGCDRGYQDDQLLPASADRASNASYRFIDRLGVESLLMASSSVLRFPAGKAHVCPPCQRCVFGLLPAHFCVCIYACALRCPGEWGKWLLTWIHGWHADSSCISAITIYVVRRSRSWAKVNTGVRKWHRQYGPCSRVQHMRKLVVSCWRTGSVQIYRDLTWGRSGSKSLCVELG